MRKDLNEDLMAYQDGELPPDRAQNLRSELAANSELRERANELRALDALLDLVEPAQVSPGFASKVIERARGGVAATSEVGEDRRGRFLGFARSGLARSGYARAAAAALLLIGAVGIYLVTTGKDVSPVEAESLLAYGALADPFPLDGPIPDLDAALRDIEAIGEIYLGTG